VEPDRDQRVISAGEIKKVLYQLPKLLEIFQGLFSTKASFFTQGYKIPDHLFFNNKFASACKRDVYTH
jgi:hypothetical protein